MKPTLVLPVEVSEFSDYWKQYLDTKKYPDPEVVFKNLIRNIPNFALGQYYWIVICVPENKTIASGGDLLEMTGKTKDWWNGNSPQESFIHFKQEDIPILMAYVMQVNQFLLQHHYLNSQKVKATIYCRIQKQNELKWVCVQYPGMYYDSKGNLIYVLAVVSDISHIKKGDGLPFLSIIDYNSEQKHIYLSHNPKAPIELVNHPIQLTKRETDIIQLLCKGYSSKQMAVQLNIAKKTVDNVRQHLLNKMGATSSTEILSKAIEWG